MKPDLEDEDAFDRAMRESEEHNHKSFMRIVSVIILVFGVGLVGATWLVYMLITRHGG